MCSDGAAYCYLAKWAVPLAQHSRRIKRGYMGSCASPGVDKKQLCILCDNGVSSLARDHAMR
jgi:hypothetical protein